MGTALPLPLRLQIVQQKSNGKNLRAIARETQLSYTTVRRIWKRYRAKGTEGLAPDYDKCNSAGPRCAPVIQRASLWLRRVHPDWGAAFIRLQLQNRYGEQRIPVERTLQRWFKAAGLCRRKSRFPLLKKTWAAAVHDTWQIDAKEKLHLASGQKVCYLTIVDEMSGALLRAWVFPPLPDQSGGDGLCATKLDSKFSRVGVAQLHPG